MVLLLVSLLLLLEAAAGKHYGHFMPGSPRDISKNNPNLLRAVSITTKSFNDKINDAFLFRASSIQKAQQQIVKGIKYIVDLELSRTICHKRDHKDLVECDFQPEGPLHQTIRCHCEVWAIPWLKVMKTVRLRCSSFSDPAARQET